MEDETVKIFVKKLTEQDPQFTVKLARLYNLIPVDKRKEASPYIYSMLRSAEKLGLNRNLIRRG